MFAVLLSRSPAWTFIRDPEVFIRLGDEIVDDRDPGRAVLEDAVRIKAGCESSESVEDSCADMGFGEYVDMGLGEWVRAPLWVK